jgi:hypothetical protein
MNGKGDAPRNCFSQQYRDNYDRIFGEDDIPTTKPCPAVNCRKFRKCPLAKPIGIDDNPEDYDQNYAKKTCYSPR